MKFMARVVSSQNCTERLSPVHCYFSQKISLSILYINLRELFLPLHFAG